MTSWSVMWRIWLSYPETAVEALRDLVLKQAAARARAGTAWRENDLVFCTSRGGPMYATDVRMEFKRITEKAGLGRDWTPVGLPRS
jgi:hypothetical protein